MPSNPSTIHAKLIAIQRDLKVEKGQWNDFSKFSYRSKEDIVEAAKPLCHELGITLTCNDEVMCLTNGWVYIVSTATITDAETGQSLSSTGLAREAESKKGMDASQITGTASSYAGKRALGNLFAIDDTKDCDSQATAKPEVPDTGSFVAFCRSCGTTYSFEDKQQYDSFTTNPTCCPNPAWEVR